MEQEKFETGLDENKELENAETQIETEVQRAQKKRREAIFEMGLFFVLGILIGVTLKTEAVKKITMGFNDYQIKKAAQSFDVATLKKNLEEEFAQQQAAQQAQQQIQTQGVQQQQQEEK